MTIPLEGGQAVTAQSLCTPGLWRLLTEGDDWRSSVRLIAINPALKAEAERVAPEVTERGQGAGDAWTDAAIRGHMQRYGLGDLPESAFELMARPYVATLAHLPAEAITEAFARWDRCEAYPKAPGRHVVMPTPDEIATLAEPRRLLLGQAAYRIRRALEKIETTAPRKPLPEVADGFRDLMAALGKPRPVPTAVELRDATLAAIQDVPEAFD